MSVDLFLLAHLGSTRLNHAQNWESRTRRRCWNNTSGVLKTGFLERRKFHETLPCYTLLAFCPGLKIQLPGIQYVEFSEKLTKKPSPYPWQESFSQWTGEKVAAVSASTGAGKESGAVLPWLYGHTRKLDIPSRLIYCLPTRSLVDQVHSNIKTLVSASGLDISIHCLKGD